MATNNPSHWHNRLVTFFLAAAASASVLFWVLQWPTASPSARNTLVLNAPDAIDTRKVAQVLGERATSTSDTTISNTTASTTFKLLGVVATGQRNGSALMATDASSARPYRVGDRVSDKLVLQSVSVRSVVLAEGLDAPGGITLKLPDPSGLN